jgi:hypothetical protein
MWILAVFAGEMCKTNRHPRRKKERFRKNNIIKGQPAPFNYG